ncbi:MAG: NBR1-Ig-like domain-containing protein [Pelolinea sp.]|nr:NBR1-Ig-like domain-containing protein [Pelolinea sp.]
MLKNRNKIVSILMTGMMIVLACTISSEGGLNEEEKLKTAVAQTITAKESESQQDTLQPLPTITVAPTDTQASAPTNTPQPCNKAEFVSETIDDETKFNANTPFTKTWRLKNIGTCTWNTNYELTYASGDKMSGPATQKLPQNVAPGEQIDISVNLIAPASEGTYQGFWKIADDNGQFYVNNIWVKIKVKPVPLNNYTVSLDAKVAEGGSIWSNGDMYPGDYGVGDAVGDFGIQTFAAFDISGIPSNAVITEVKVDFTNFLTLGNPFGGLGCLRLYPDPYRPLSMGDYTPPPVTGANVRWCSSAELSAVSVESDLADYLQSRLGNPYMAIRLQFNEHETDGDNGNDVLGFFVMSLEIKYQAP